MSKKPPKINFSLFYEPLRGDRKPYSVSSHFTRLTPFYLSLLQDLIKFIRRPRTIHIGKTKIIITLLWALMLWPAPDNTQVFADDMGLKKVAVTQTHKPITTSPEPLGTIKPVVVARKAPVAPKPVTSAPVGSCGDNYYANYIYMRESGCRTHIYNSIGCYGIGQSCPASKIAHCGADYACQNAWFSNYAVQRYGSWQGAYNFWLRNHWW